ncbi:MAG TPA: hypothetical protein VNN77_05785 [candidate division Zixibacteria bacterium]|nr:hypothetical protein [candidate division Zixibacteria bacterium]
MAKKKPRKKHRLRAVLLFVLTPFVLWAAFFFGWLYWRDIQALWSNGPAVRSGPEARPQGNARRSENRGRESISEEDRRKLNELLQNR